MKKVVKIATILSACVFLISGFGKMFNVAAFGNLIVKYGFPYASILAPLIVFLEIVVALFLLLSIYQKYTSLIAAILIVIFTALFAYANTFHGITDCGCFGSINKLSELPPYVVYIRNATLFILLLFVWRKSVNTTTIQTEKIAFLATVILISSFVIGFTFELPASYKQNKKHPLYHMPVNKTILPEFLTLSPDSTYTLFVFAYHCSSCWNAIENLKAYSTPEISDRLIAIAMDKDKNNAFHNFFHPNFDILEVDGQKFSAFTDVVPTLVYIKNDSIQSVVVDIVPSVYFFKKNYLNYNDTLP
ncbi:MAG: DoxX family protein [Bacteroidales bacterium]|nr:DoxX family protein [Bacteroidales bacterium]